MPSVKSRELGFYYAHPQNRFWKTLAYIMNEDIPITKDEKKIFLKKHHIALWDVIKSCTITGSSDASIKNVKVNDIKSIIDKSNIQKIFTTGKKAYELYQKYCYQNIGIKAIYLPSTSPANNAVDFEQLVSEYQQILD